jgi:hypothetical protein
VPGAARTEIGAAANARTAAASVTARALREARKAFEMQDRMCLLLVGDACNLCFRV